MPGRSSMSSLPYLCAMQPVTMMCFADLCSFSFNADISSKASTESSRASSMNPHVFTIMTSASSGSFTTTWPFETRSPSITSASTVFLEHPSCTIATRGLLHLPSDSTPESCTSGPDAERLVDEQDAPVRLDVRVWSRTSTAAVNAQRPPSLPVCDGRFDARSCDSLHDDEEACELNPEVPGKKCLCQSVFATRAATNCELGKDCIPPTMY
mmetsp:Transcript_49518/g.115849  ORF Transcript_49518/g.115849 Transcript_49518/m.115849 type:complete len:211 (-) Transcript_49518:14-646(-)